MPCQDHLPFLILRGNIENGVIGAHGGVLLATAFSLLQDLLDLQGDSFLGVEELPEIFRQDVEDATIIQVCEGSRGTPFPI
jgi:hypothetical protein